MALFPLNFLLWPICLQVRSTWPSLGASRPRQTHVSINLRVPVVQAAVRWGRDWEEVDIFFVPWY